MSEPKWTPAQRAAIEDRGGALLVAAALLPTRSILWMQTVCSSSPLPMRRRQSCGPASGRRF